MVTGLGLSLRSIGLFLLSIAARDEMLYGELWRCRWCCVLVAALGADSLGHFTCRFGKSRKFDVDLVLWSKDCLPGGCGWFNLCEMVMVDPLFSLQSWALVGRSIYCPMLLDCCYFGWMRFWPEVAEMLAFGRSILDGWSARFSGCGSSHALGLVYDGWSSTSVDA
ncbi:hypothetical protein Nepgr_015832 [Nepenthes gracilis]|uniref:Uncharacterized protein n=1 Tax=Nepenthes gracilis TaxID=150966 RepID=A0AAD3SPB4_NEPGR|nr:hypothetical protein Nepgr_015832 [Nepenthes gracilis]